MAYFIPHPVVLTPVTPYEQARALFNQRQAQVNQLKIQLAHLQAPAALGLPVNTAVITEVMTQLVQARIQRDLAKVHKDSLDPRLIASKVASTGKAKSGSSKRSSGKAKSGSSKRSSGKAKSRSSKTSAITGYRAAAASTSVLPGARATSSVLPGARATSSVPFPGGTAFVPGGGGFYYF